MKNTGFPLLSLSPFSLSLWRSPPFSSSLRLAGSPLQVHAASARITFICLSVCAFLSVATIFLTHFRDGDVAHTFEAQTSKISDTSASCDDDWEVIADRASHEPCCVDLLTRTCKLSLESSASCSEHKPPSRSSFEDESPIPRRRGRGSFMYGKDVLYSDQQRDFGDECGSEDEVDDRYHTKPLERKASQYGTSHVLVLAGFPSSTQTIDLEKDFQRFRERGFVIRWVDDTTALAVFTTPEIAYEAQSSLHCGYSVHILDEGDRIFGSVSVKDLEPPHPRPKTSIRTAQRLIAHGMGQKLSSNFNAMDLRKQEKARRIRIQERQNLRNDAWGDDEP